ncbi:MAG: hypothetical protein F4W90_08240 [Gammaproteobacteria bacterium]|nr:hypothetical protein [Gammaproteobacteria bacterium]
MTALNEIERSLALFAQGLSQRVPIFRVDERERAVSTSSLNELFLPAEFDFFTDFESNRNAFRWAVLQQLAFRRYDTLTFAIDEARARFNYLAVRPLPTAHRLPDIELFYQHFPVPGLASYLFFLLEETRVANLITAEFPGALRLRRSYKTYRLASLPLFPADSPFTEFTVLEANLQEPQKMPYRIRELVEPVLATNATVYAAAEATIRCYEAFCAQVPANAAQHMESTLQENVVLPVLQRAARLEDWEQELNDLDAELQAFTFGEAIEATEAEVENSLDGNLRETAVEVQQERDQLQRRIDLERSVLSNYRANRIVDSAHFRYDEWDYLHKTWLKAWCSVYEIRQEHDLQESTTQLVKAIRPFLPQVRKRFEQVKPIGLRRISHSIDGDELDLDAIVEARADLKAKISPTEHVYSRVDRTQRDVSACLLVDLSASTDDPIVQPEPKSLAEDAEDPFDDPYLHGGLDFDPEQRETEAQRKIIDVQKESVLLLAAALEDLGDLYSVYGFSGYGRECVEIHVAKEFNETLNRQTMDAIAAMKPLRSTRMGPAIRHAVYKLGATGSALKVLLVISDGFPQDSDYGPDRGNHEYGIQDTARAIQEAAEKGIQVFCVTVDVSGHDYLRRMCRADQYWVIEDTEELPNALQFAYRQLTI